AARLQYALVCRAVIMLPSSVVLYFCRFAFLPLLSRLFPYTTLFRSIRYVPIQLTLFLSLEYLHSSEFGPGHQQAGCRGFTGSGPSTSLDKKKNNDENI